jgi:hypothetical protein
MKLTIGILSYKSPKTLYNTLLSYQISGLLDYTDDTICIIQPSFSQNEEFEICKKFNISNIIVNEINTKMAGGIDIIHINAKYDNILFLEVDFRVCITKEKLYKLLDHSLNMLKNNEVDVIRLRSLENPGHQIQHNLYKKSFNSDNIENKQELYLIMHFLTHPHIILPDYVKKLYDSPLIYSMKSENCVYTNNPTIIKKSFYNTFIKPHVIYGCTLEPIMDKYWANLKLDIGVTEGCFTHMRMDGHVNCHCCPIVSGGMSNNCMWFCCDNNIIKSPKNFEEQDLI